MPHLYKQCCMLYMPIDCGCPSTNPETSSRSVLVALVCQALLELAALLCNLRRFALWLVVLVFRIIHLRTLAFDIRSFSAGALRMCKSQRRQHLRIVRAIVSALKEWHDVLRLAHDHGITNMPHDRGMNDGTDQQTSGTAI